MHLLNPSFDGLFQPEQALGQTRVGRSRDHINSHHGDPPRGVAVDNAQPAPGQPRVDSQHAHVFTVAW
jgi:hypothetical protein